jgi:hypothetical protein
MTAAHLETIGRLPWRVAKTMPEIPHEYTGRQPENEELYFALFRMIQTDGVIERSKGRKKRYPYPGDGRKHLAMTTHMPSSHVLNRMLVEDDPGGCSASSRTDRADAARYDVELGDRPVRPASGIEAGRPLPVGSGRHARPMYSFYTTASC